MTTDHAFADDLNWLLHRVGWGIGGLLDGATKESGLSIRDYVVLRTVSDRPGMSQLALGAALGLDKTAITVVFDRLERNGFISRVQLPSDRRVRAAQVTEAGSAVVSQAAHSVEAVYCHVLADLDRDQLHGLLDALQRLASSEAINGAPPTGSCM